MAVTQHTRNVMKYGCKSQPIADEICDAIDAGSGTISTAARDRLKQICNNDAIGDALGDVVDAGTGITGQQESVLGVGLANRTAAAAIASELA